MATPSRPSLRIRWLPLLVLVLLAAALPLGTAAAQAPAAKSILNVPFKGVAAPASTFDLVESIIDFNPGSTSHVITTGMPHYLSVLSGELTVTVDGDAQTVVAAKGVAVPAGAKLTLANTSTSPAARLFVSTLVEVGAVTDVHLLSPAGVNVFATARRTMSNAPGVVDVVQMAAVYDVGYRTANHVMNEFHLMIHLSGKIGYAYLDGGVESYGPGSQAAMYEGRPGWMRNDGPDASSMAWTWVGTPGKPLSSAVPATNPPAPPNTGTSLAQDRTAITATLAATALVLASLGASALAAMSARRNPPAR